MTPGRYDLNLYRGDTYRWRFRLWEDDFKTVPVDLTGSTVAAEFRDKPGVATVVALDTTLTEPNIYTSKDDGSGGTLLASSQAEPTDTIGGKTLTLNQTVPAGDYWVAIHIAGTGTAPTLRSGSNNTPERLYSTQANPTSVGAYNCRYSTSVPSLPATLPTGAQRLGMPICWVRVSPTRPAP